jgi:hypothetical protein
MTKVEEFLPSSFLCLEQIAGIVKTGLDLIQGSAFAHC